jgi:hypothetical protein
MRKLLLVITLITIAKLTFGQSFYAIRKDRSVILTGGIGTSTYFGELANPGDYIDAKPTINLGLQYYMSRRVSLRSEVIWFSLRGDDAKADHGGRIKRNLSFHSNNIEVNATASINLTPNGNRYYRRPQFNLYAFGGISGIYFNPKADLNGETYALQPLMTEGVSYSRITFAIPFGLGIRKKLTPNMNLAIEAGYRKTFTDYLDDVSTTYPDLSTLSEPAKSLSFRGQEKNLDQPIPTSGKKRGSPDTKDGYMLVNLKIEYYLPWDLGGQNNGRTYSRKRSSFYRYNKKGGFKR